MADDELDPMKCVERGFKRGREAERKLHEAKIALTEDELCATMRALIAVDRKLVECESRELIYDSTKGYPHLVAQRNCGKCESCLTLAAYDAARELLNGRRLT